MSIELSGDLTRQLINGWSKKNCNDTILATNNICVHQTSIELSGDLTRQLISGWNKIVLKPSCNKTSTIRHWMIKQYSSLNTWICCAVL